MVNVFTKDNCDKCNSAKEKLHRLNIEFNERPYEFYTNYHEGWREDGSVDVLTALTFFGDSNIPVIEEDGRFFDYPAFMKKAKQSKRADCATGA